MFSISLLIIDIFPSLSLSQVETKSVRIIVWELHIIIIKNCEKVLFLNIV